MLRLWSDEQAVGMLYSFQGRPQDMRSHSGAFRFLCVSNPKDDRTSCLMVCTELEG